MTAENTKTLVIKFPRCASKARECEALTLPELYAIWAGLPADRRLSLLISLDADIADRLVDYCAWAKQHQNGA